MRTRIQSVNAMEILDSRGFPTVRVHLVLDDGTLGTASIPSGASTGENEATELRDDDPKRYYGKGVLTAVGNVNHEIRSALTGRDPFQQAQIDKILIDLDGTDNKSRLGANAILGASQAVARVALSGRCRESASRRNQLGAAQARIAALERRVQTDA